MVKDQSVGPKGKGDSENEESDHYQIDDWLVGDDEDCIEYEDDSSDEGTSDEESESSDDDVSAHRALDQRDTVKNAKKTRKEVVRKVQKLIKRNN